MRWIRSRRRETPEPVAEHCVGCRAAVATDEAERRASGAVLLAGAGWFCGPRCEQQYRFRFRIGLTTRDADVGRSPVPIATPPGPVEAVEESELSAEDLLAVLRERRRRLMNGG